MGKNIRQCHINVCYAQAVAYKYAHLFILRYNCTTFRLLYPKNEWFTLVVMIEHHSVVVTFLLRVRDIRDLYSYTFMEWSPLEEIYRFYENRVFVIGIAKFLDLSIVWCFNPDCNIPSSVPFKIFVSNSKEPATGPCPELDESSPHHTVFLRSTLMLSWHLRIGVFFQVFVLFFSPPSIRRTHTFHPSILYPYLVKCRNFEATVFFYNFPCLPLLRLFLGPNILLSFFFLNILTATVLPPGIKFHTHTRKQVGVDLIFALLDALRTGLRKVGSVSLRIDK